LETLDDNCLKHNYLNYLKWTEPIAMMLNLLENREQALRVVKLALEVDLQLGARLAGEVLNEWQYKTVEMLLEYDLPKSVAIKLLEKTKSANAITFLDKALQHSDSEVRRSAAKALRMIGSEQAVVALRQALHDSDSEVRHRAAEALGMIGSEQAVVALRQALHDSDSYVRSSAANALGMIGSEQAVSALTPALQHSDSGVRCRVAEALGNIGSEQAVSALIPTLQNSNSAVRWIATDILKKIGYPEIMPRLLELIPTKIGIEILSAIAAIQERYRFYNYDIYQQPIPEKSSPTLPPPGNTYHFYDQVGQVINDLNVQGNNTGVQNRNNSD
jgi:tetratricopeptide (TPR) repeat protein